MSTRDSVLMFSNLFELTVEHFNILGQVVSKNVIL